VSKKMEPQIKTRVRVQHGETLQPTPVLECKSKKVRRTNSAPLQGTCRPKMECRQTFGGGAGVNDANERRGTKKRSGDGSQGQKTYPHLGEPLGKDSLD